MSPDIRHVTVIQHLSFEDLGSFEAVLQARGASLTCLQAGVDEVASAIEQADLTIVLGGPIGVYEADAYPFLHRELDALRQRLQASRPTLGICLGAQLMAQAAGGRVYPGHGKEIGWSPLTLSPAGQASCLSALEGVDVLHWHGDTFDLPPGAQRLASTQAYANQAFSLGPNGLGLQFHPEAQHRTFERWLIGHAAELAGAGLSVTALREQAGRHAQALEVAGAAMFSQWLNQLRT